MAMMNDQDKERIRREEIYRQEVRQEIAESAQRKTFRKRIWAFMNSPLGLWFLSTVAIGMLTWSYSQWQANEAREKEDQQHARRLYMEVVMRIKSVGNLLANAQNKEQFFGAMSILDNPTLGNLSFSIFPQFRNRSVRSLLWELALLDKAKELDRIESAIGAATQISERYQKTALELDSSSDLGEEPISKEEVEEVENLLNSILEWIYAPLSVPGLAGAR
jgi:hypothetical protein